MKTITNDELFMKKAIELSEMAVEHGNEPFGAVLVKDGEIVFTNEKSGESITLKVSALFRAPDFASLFESVDAKKCGLFSQSPENEMLKYYTKEEIEKYGVLAIALSRTE